MFSCEICDKEFRSPSMVKRHKRQVHKLESKEPVKIGRPRGNTFTCDLCDFTSSNQKMFRDHTKGHHPTEYSFAVIQLSCPVAGCDSSFINRQKLAQHVLLVHTDEICQESGIKEMSFDSIQEFKLWKIEEENRNRVRYVSPTGPKRVRPGIIVRSYICHRSGITRSRGNGSRCLKLQGSCKIGKICPAMIKLTETTDSPQVKIVYLNVHFGHTNDLKHMTLSREEREHIASCLIDNSSDSKVIARIEFLPNPLELDENLLEKQKERIAALASELKVKTFDPGTSRDSAKLKKIEQIFSEALLLLNCNQTEPSSCLSETNIESKNEFAKPRWRYFTVAKTDECPETILPEPEGEETVITMDSVSNFFIKNELSHDHSYTTTEVKS